MILAEGIQGSDMSQCPKVQQWQMYRKPKVIWQAKSNQKSDTYIEAQCGDAFWDTQSKYQGCQSSNKYMGGRGAGLGAMKLVLWSCLILKLPNIMHTFDLYSSWIEVLPLALFMCIWYTSHNFFLKKQRTLLFSFII